MWCAACFYRAACLLHLCELASWPAVLHVLASGMSSSDPTHAWRSPQFRARVPLRTYRRVLSTRESHCITFSDLLTRSALGGHHSEQGGNLSAAGRGVLAHLKVDAEGADVGIVRAAIAAAQGGSCVWPWRIDFEAKHTHGADTAGANVGAYGYPTAFTLAGFPAESVVSPLTVDVLNALEASSHPQPTPHDGERLPPVNGRYVRAKEPLGGAPAFVWTPAASLGDDCGSSSAAQWVVSFRYKLGVWVISSGFDPDAPVAAFVDSGLSWSTPWDTSPPWRHGATQPVGERDVTGIVWLAVPEARVQAVETESVAREFGRAAARPSLAETGSGGGIFAGPFASSEELVLELEEQGYACECMDLDCTCFTTPQKVAALHPECTG